MNEIWSQRAEQRIAKIVDLGRRRAPRVFEPVGQVGSLEGCTQPVCAFASNDYLGLSHHPAVVSAASEAAERMGVGAGASRLVTGSRPVHKELEEEIASWKGTERSVLFPTGYQANIGVLGSLGEDDVLICSDELNHASIIDGCRLSRARVAVYRHLDMEHLDSILSGWHGMSMIVSDLVFSMDGDTAPVAELAALCRRYDALLVLDEAHYVIGPDPGSLLEGVAVLRVGTLSKTLGAQGGVVAGPSLFIQLLENVARSYIFSTALSPVVASAALAAIRVYRSSEGDRLRSALARNVNELGGDTQIIPIIIGPEEDAVRASSELLAMGMWVPAIRPPTVPVGTSRLRVSLSADHSIDQVRTLRNALDRLGLWDYSGLSCK